MLLIVLLRQGGSPSATSLPPTVSPSPIAIGSPDDRQNDNLVQIPANPPYQAELQKEQLTIPPTPPPFDKAAVEIDRKIAGSLKAEMRERTRKLYGAAFQQLGLSASLEEKVIGILTQQEQQLEQQAYESAQSGNVPIPPSPEEMQAQQAQQENQLRSVLGDAGFAQFNQYQATIPDRIIIDQMSQQGANLNENQSTQLLQVLTEARQQIFGPAGAASNLNSMPPDQAIGALQKQQALLQQTVNDRVQSILTPDQSKALQGVISGLTVNAQGH